MISIVGAGGVGGLLAALLERSGQDVTVVLRAGSAERVARVGLEVESVAFGRLRAHPHAATAVPEDSSVILAVKASGLADVLPGVAAARPSEVLSLLNGVSHAQVIHRELDAACPRVACGSASVLSARREDGVIKHTSGGVGIGVPDDAADWRLTRALASAGCSVGVGGSESEVLWEKFSRLAPFALVTAWADADVPTAVGRDPALVRGVLDETARIATAHGYDVDAGTLAAWLPGSGARASLSHDVRRGSEGELRPLGDDLIALGRLVGVPTPALDRVVREIRTRL